MRLIDADALNSIKFHPLPYTHIVPDDVNAESYQRGWNDAVDAIVENALTIEPERKTGHWIEFPNHYAYKCSECGRLIETVFGKNRVHKQYPYCHCGAAMIEEGAQE